LTTLATPLLAIGITQTTAPNSKLPSEIQTVEQEAASTPKRIQLLLIEADHSVADEIAAVLDMHRIDVHSVSGAEAAKEALGQRRYDAILLYRDELPGRDGVTLIRFVRALEGTVPVLIVSTSLAAARNEAVVEGYESSGGVYSVDDLAIRLRALTRRGAGSGPSVMAFGPVAFGFERRSRATGSSYGRSSAATPRRRDSVSRLGGTP
jgi:DNA-binding response OmpR family regulator